MLSLQDVQKQAWRDFWPLGHAVFCSAFAPSTGRLNHYDTLGRILSHKLELSFHPGSALNQVIVSKVHHLFQRPINLTRGWSGGGNWTKFLRLPHLILWVCKGRAAWYAGTEHQNKSVKIWILLVVGSCLIWSKSFQISEERERLE